MYIYICVCVYIYICIFVYVYIYICMCIYMYIPVYNIYIYMYDTYVCMYVYVYVCIHKDSGELGFQLSISSEVCKLGAEAEDFTWIQGTDPLPCRAIARCPTGHINISVLT